LFSGAWQIIAHQQRPSQHLLCRAHCFSIIHVHVLLVCCASLHPQSCAVAA
jgi:hypothetical protein